MALSFKNISISGLATSGKDTFADYLLDKFPYRKDHFARPLKDAASYWFGWDGQKDDKGRKLLQLLGTEVGRGYFNAIWLFKFADANAISYEKEFTPPHNRLSPFMRRVRFLKLALAYKMSIYGGLDVSIVNPGSAFAYGLSENVIPCDPAQYQERIKMIEESSKKRLSENKARLMAFCELGWDGVENEAGRKLIKGIQELAMEYNPSYWETHAISINKIYRQLFCAAARSGQKEQALIVPDCRFPDELELLKRAGFISVRISRPGLVAMGHASERALEKSEFDETIDNDGSMNDFYQKIEQMTSKLKK
jgi:hypothetical protein